jgi:hypothetical protein
MGISGTLRPSDNQSGRISFLFNEPPACGFAQPLAGAFFSDGIQKENQ